MLSGASIRPLLDEVEEWKKRQDEHRVDQPPLRDQQGRAALATGGRQAARGRGGGAKIAKRAAER